RHRSSPASRLPQKRVHSADDVLFDNSGLVRECSISASADASDVPAFSRTSPLLQKEIAFLQWMTGCLIRERADQRKGAAKATQI
ncbi:hypothetical protein, partial [Pseudomonas viridiflava]|uniref:hypothetical protein n=1 Tax=Pseudomonas viridiflava TaxID=33069 RepID=UPI00197B1135